MPLGDTRRKIRPLQLSLQQLVSAMSSGRQHPPKHMLSYQGHDLVATAESPIFAAICSAPGPSPPQPLVLGTARPLTFRAAITARQLCQDANTLTFKSTLPVAMTHRILTLAASSFFGAPFAPFASPLVTAGTSFTTPGAQRIQLTK